jgi:glycosyltransferase involved in cell wall biosynthesis
MAGLTVLFSTFNGASTLPRMLGALERLEPPPGGWKIVAVDNASTDDSMAVLRRWTGRLPLTVLTEPRQGKNVGLNTGLASVEGDLVVLTDDDVVPREDWLVQVRRLADRQPDYDIFGGAVFPLWPAPPPDWVLRSVPKGHFAWTDFDDGPAGPLQIWGPNMSVRSEVFRDFKFLEGDGPDGTASYATGSEAGFVLRAAGAGHRCWHATSVVVGHIVRPRQLTPEWLLQRSYNLARGARRVHGTDGEDRARMLFGYPRSLLRRYAGAWLGVAASSVAGGFEERFVALRVLREVQGDLAERRFQRRARF